MTLQLKGTIWKPVDVNPMFAMINVPPDYPPNNSATVHIVSNEEQPLTLSAPESNNKAFTAEVKTNQPGKDFQLVIMATLAPDSGNAQGQISVKTSSTNVPVINLTAWANVQPLVTLIPQQVMLPSGPTTEGQTAAVTIQNNSTNALLLSDPSVDAKDVKVDIKETQAPGKAYTATLTFPAGFEIAQGTKTELSIKTSSQRTPVIKIPVLQMPHPQSPVITPITPVPAPPGKTPTLSGKPVTQ